MSPADDSFEGILKCVHCGLCLDACPTYRELGTEQDSPRGRLFLMRGLWEGDLMPSAEVAAPLSRCLDCRACESACPSGVPYGALFEMARERWEIQPPSSRLAKIIRKFAVTRLLPNRSLLLWASRILALLQKSGLTPVTQKLTARFSASKGLAHAIALMPPFTSRSFTREHAGIQESAAIASPTQKARPLVALFTGCIMDVAETSIHEATLKVLHALGYDVWIPAAQGCCGALAVHNGSRAAARVLARTNLNVFSQPPRPLEALIINAAGCGAQLKSYHLLLNAACASEKNTECSDFEGKCVDILVFLNRIAAEKNLPWQLDSAPLLYDAPCHLRHAQQQEAAPRNFFERLLGKERFIPLKESDSCCGAAGIYNLQQPQLSDAILARKLDDLESTLKRHPSACFLLSGNPGCIFQLRYGIKSRKLPLRVLHPIEWLASCLPQHEG